MVDRQRLLTALVGVEGAQALAKAAVRLPELDNAMAPRALFAWLSLAGNGYDGQVPGLDASRLALSKSESGYSGSLAIDGTDYEFVDVSLLHVSAAVGVMAGLSEQRVDPRVRDDDLYRLGKTVDVLVRARAVVGAMKKNEDDLPEYTFEHEHDASVQPPTTTIYAYEKGQEVAKVVLVDDDKVRSWTVEPGAHALLEGKLQDVVTHITGKPLEKADDGGVGKSSGAPGPPHKPTAASDALPPTPPSMKQDAAPGAQKSKKIPVPPKPKLSVPGLSKLKLSEKQLDIKCSVCDGSQVENQAFVGCYCFRDLGRFVKMEKKEGIASLSFGAEWTEDVVLAFLDSVKVLKKAAAQTPVMWGDKRVLHPDHIGGLDLAAAKYEFGDRMPRSQAEAKAHEDYTREQRLDAAAHHLMGSKASLAAGDHESARKHGALYHAHLEALGMQPVGPVPPEVTKRLAMVQGVHKFKAHTGDLLTLAPGEPAQSSGHG